MERKAKVIVMMWLSSMFNSDRKIRGNGLYVIYFRELGTCSEDFYNEIA